MRRIKSQEPRAKNEHTFSHASCFLPHASLARRGFTLIETLVAVSLLSIAIVAPMTLASKSLSTAYYARDQITAFYLAQEGIEAVRALRDAQILQITQSPSGSQLDIFGLIPKNGAFTIDGRKQYSDADPPPPCPDGALAPTYGCDPLKTDGVLYGYENDSTWKATNFTRAVQARFVSGGQDEIRVTVTVTWKTGSIQQRSFSISEDMYRWVNDGSAQP